MYRFNKRSQSIGISRKKRCQHQAEQIVCSVGRRIPKDQVVAPLDSKYHAGLGFRITLQRLDTSSARSHRPL